MAEVSELADKPVDRSTIVGEVVEGLRTCGLIGDTHVVSPWHRRLEYGNPTPWRGSDTVRTTLLD
jgi:hypothetical protein